MSEQDVQKLSKVEQIKADSRHLRGTIAEALQDGTTHFSEENVQVLKFHGVYQQDDRDLRKILKKEGKERAYTMMVRARIPGGVLNADQYLQFDRLGDMYGGGSLRITTRQTFQLHYILKSNLKETIRGINEVLLTTLGGCGDQVRNTVCCAAPHHGAFYDQVREDLLSVVNAVSAKTNAYHEIWLDGQKVDLGNDAEEEPLYGRTYLPRKFKIAFTYEGDNCCDVYSHDIGVVAHRDGDAVAGYTLIVGGGMGRTASDKNTHPALGQPLAFVTRAQLLDVCTAIVKVQRDYGNRVDRKFARMKYLIEKRGLDWFRRQVEAYYGGELQPPRELKWESSADHLGSHRDESGKAYIGIFVENGRLRDTAAVPLKSLLRDIVAKYRPVIRLTTQQNMILSELTESQVREIEEILRGAGVPLAEELPPSRLESMACVALPTCGLAIAESERVFPKVIREFEAMLQELGLGDTPVSLRMTGCPNGCARPYIAEIGFVGRVIGKYDVFLGASPDGSRMNTLFKEMVPLAELASTLRPLLQAYAAERQPGERFGDYCHRVGFDRLHALETLSVS
ncbi:sulfite reductase subunit beta [Alicyclobacillus contaminans]|uniref:NADPH-dependent assimilatory sulfite reductase hemoprotein subunit n=1 Tax=Alicyclobacillus contaminans TaxID=392016 RepID=UPI0003F529A8|nr:NADPH-dependent assimilatory sulfite reductase hemoprotein subunit [Alicyclobacillus contaminans]GMA50642.1 sulfite reductase subunit beta [Alicyclobacillus contaminans]